VPPKRVLYMLCLAAVVGGLLLLYSYSNSEKPAIPIGHVVQIPAPLGLPPVPIPADNPPTAETIALGRRLYYDAALSVDNTVSCSTCHMPGMAFSDGKRVSNGVGGKSGVRNAPTVLNSAYFSLQFWDGRAPSLEKQAEGPVANPVEMAHTLKGVVQRLSQDPSYVAAFEKAFGPGPITYDKVEKCIASFERTVLSGDSAFDRYYYGHDQAALTPAQIHGLEVFHDRKKGNCESCHTIGENAALFTDNKFHNIGVGFVNGETSDKGRYVVTKNVQETGAFRTPTLRNVDMTAPYMHDGSLNTMKQVMDFYIGAGNSNPYLDKEIHSLDFLSREERDDLLEFMKALTGTMPPNVGPSEVPTTQAAN
jgi:cytochrome c peroxidase